MFVVIFGKKDSFIVDKVNYKYVKVSETREQAMENLTAYLEIFDDFLNPGLGDIKIIDPILYVETLSENENEKYILIITEET